MLHILSPLFSFVRLGPIGLGIGAAIMLGIGYFLQVSQNDRIAAVASALAAGPPAAVDVAKFNHERDATDLREVAFTPPDANETTMFGIFSKIAGAIGLLALAKLVFRNEPQDQPEAPEAIQPTLSPEIAPAPKPMQPRFGNSGAALLTRMIMKSNPSGLMNPWSRSLPLKFCELQNHAQNSVSVKF